MTQDLTTNVEALLDRWESALRNHNAEALLATYAEDALLESPLVTHVMGREDGLLRGTAAMRPFFEAIVKRTPTLRAFHRDAFWTDGRRLVCEYPHVTPSGEQMDFVEVMEIEGGLIQRHRVYWGWRGVGMLINDGYYR